MKWHFKLLQTTAQMDQVISVSPNFESYLRFLNLKLVFQTHQKISKKSPELSNAIIQVIQSLQYGLIWNGWTWPISGKVGLNINIILNTQNSHYCYWESQFIKRSKSSDILYDMTKTANSSNWAHTWFRTIVLSHGNGDLVNEGGSKSMYSNDSHPIGNDSEFSNFQFLWIHFRIR